MKKRLKERNSSITGQRTTLKNNEIKDVIKVIKSLVNRGILFRGTTRKITNQEGGFLGFLRPLMKATLPLMKSVLTPLANTFSISLELSGGMSLADVAIQKKTYQSGTTVWIISNEETEDIMEIAKSSEKSGLIKKELVK